MSEGMRIARRRNITVFTNHAERATFKRGAFSDYDLFSSYVAGEVEAGLPTSSQISAPQSYSLANELLSSLNLILNMAASRNLGPTRS
jgi:hypothetical protein